MRRKNFYCKIIKKYLKNKIKNTILVLGAGNLDKEILKKYSNTFFTNINAQNEKMIKNGILMQNLPYNNNSYDYVITHASIHHCSRPHAAILEMLRVAKYGVIFIESHDCLLTKLSCKLGFSEIYEYSAVESDAHGGVDNTNIPNFVYRWTEREVIKLINSYKPLNKYKIYFDYDYDFKFLNNFLINFFLWIFFHIFVNQKNLMSVYIKK
jgi:SAM-dependent methyltransferase